jgi:hypothetical protein
MVAVRRGLVAIAFFLVGSACAIGFLSATPSEAAPEGRAWTHRITSLTGEYVNHWKLNDPEPCGLVGEGTVTVKFRITVAPRVSLVYSPTAGAGPSGVGRWIIGVPSAHGPGLFDGPRRAATGTITLVDSTVQRPPEPDQECDPPQKAGCGTRSLGRTTVSFSGYNRRFLQADLAATFRAGPGGCGVGRTERFTDRFLTGGTREGDLLMRMPSVATVNRRRVLIVTGTTRKQTSSTDCEPRGTCSDDITRRVTATFRKL